MNETTPPASASPAPVPPVEAVPAPAAAPPNGAPLVAASAGPGLPGAWWITTAVIGALALVAITLALIGQQRIKSLEQELVRRQQDSQGQAIEARALAQQAQELARSAESKVALLDSRVAESALQRTQLEELIQQMSRSRDENVLADVDAAVRVAAQQSAITGSAEPLVAALRHSEERLARISQPRVERVRRALARDLDRARSVAVSDIASLTIKLDEAIRTVDDLPLLSQPERRPVAAPRPGAASSAPAASAAVPGMGWWSWLQTQSAWAGERAWSEAKSLVRVTRIANPEAVLMAPEQAWFLRENLKLRLLNARLALLSRQYDAAQADLREGLAALDRYFDRSARRVVLTADLVRQVAGQARLVNLPRPDETLAALAAAQAGR